MNVGFPFAFYLVQFAAFAFAAPFFVLYFQSVGFNGAELALVTGLPPLIQMISGPLWTGLADVTHRHRRVMSVTLLIGAVAVSALPFLSAFLPILIVVILFNGSLAPAGSFSDSATMFMLGDKKEMYGRVRLGGTIGFGIAASAAGWLVQGYGLTLAFWGAGALLFMALLVSQKFEHSTAKTAARAAPGIRPLLKNPRWLLFTSLAFAGGLNFAATTSFFFSYMRELGAAESTMGLALTVGTIAEFPVFFFGNRLLRRLKAFGLFLLAMTLTAIRLLLFAVATSPEQVLLIQLMSGLTFPAMWLAGVAYADQNAPHGRSATAQGLFGMMVFGFGPAIGSFVGGPLLASVGGKTMFLIFGIVVLVTVGVAAVLSKRLSAEQVSAPG